MSATTPSSTGPNATRSHWIVGLLAAYVLSLLAAIASGDARFDLLAAFALTTLLFFPGLRRRSLVAGASWLCAVAALAVLAARGHARVALDLMPVFVNAALCLLFAHTLARGREPLIARVIGVLEGPDRLALPRVAAYARGLTFAWALLFGAQALWLAAIVACDVPDGALAAFGATPPFELRGAAWRWYLHLGSYLSALVLLVGEYAWRRWHLRHIPHAPLPLFVARLVRRWPALVRSFAEGGNGNPR